MNLHQSLFASCRRRRPCWRLRLAAAERTVPVSAVRTGWDGMGRTERRGTKVGKGARRRGRGSRGCSQCMRILDEWTRTQATLDGETRMTAQCEWERVRVCVLTGVSAGVTGRDFGRRSLRSESPIGRVPGTCFPLFFCPPHLQAVATSCLALSTQYSGWFLPLAHRWKWDGTCRKARPCGAAWLVSPAVFAVLAASGGRSGRRWCPLATEATLLDFC